MNIQNTENEEKKVSRKADLKGAKISSLDLSEEVFLSSGGREYLSYSLSVQVEGLTLNGRGCIYFPIKTAGKSKKVSIL